MIGCEQKYHPDYSALERAYIALFGVPVVGLRIRARNVMKLLPKDLAPARILDAGSGPGVITFQLAKRFPGAIVTGVDMMEEEIEASRAIAVRAGITNARFETADISSLPYRDRFDLIVCVDILEHIEDDQIALKKLLEALNPRGTLLLHVPALTRRYPVLKETENFIVPTHVRPGYEMPALVSLAQRVGLQVKECGYTYGILETLVNNISYMITGARKRNKSIYAFAFPLLNLVGWLGSGARPGKLGAGIYLLSSKSENKEAGLAIESNP